MRALIIVSARFNPQELWGCLKTLKNHEITFDVYSLENPIRNEKTGDRFNITGLVADIDMKRLNKYDGLYIISGAFLETKDYWWHDKTRRIVEWFNEKEKMLAAICCATPTIRYAAEGKKVSYYHMIDTEDLLGGFYAILTDASLTVDGNLVTAEHQQVTVQWTEAGIAIMKGEEYKSFIKEEVSNASNVKTPLIRKKKWADARFPDKDVTKE